MTLDEARQHIGDGVVYRSGDGAVEDGVITSVSDRYVFVRYACPCHGGSKATSSAALTLLAEDALLGEDGTDGSA